MATLCSLSLPAFAQCINGIPCIDADDTTTRADPEDPSPANVSKSDHGSCSADFMNQIYARAYIEAEREVAMASVAIKKPDSVLEYTCFDQLAYQGFTAATRIFSAKQFAYQTPTYVPPESGDFADSNDTFPDQSGGGTGGNRPPDPDVDRSGDPSATGIPENGGTYTRTGKVSIDYDGSPTAYHPSNAVGDDYLENAGRPGNWWGIVTIGGTPYVQKSGPYKGYYISTTSWPDGRYGIRDYRRFTNAEVIPYVAMTYKDRHVHKVNHGDFVLLTNLSTGVQIWSIIADYAGKRANPHAELSPEAARLLGISFTRRGVGSNSLVKQEFFKGSGAEIRASKWFPHGSAGRARVLAGPKGGALPSSSSSSLASSSTDSPATTAPAANSAPSTPQATTINITTPSITAQPPSSPETGSMPLATINDDAGPSLGTVGGTMLPSLGSMPSGDDLEGATISSDIEGGLPDIGTSTYAPPPDEAPRASSSVPVNRAPVVAPGATGYERWLASISKEFETVEILTIPAFNDYLKTNFSHKFLGRDNFSKSVNVVDDYALGIYKRGSYNCPMMDMAHTLAKCSDFGDDYHQFFSLEDLITVNSRSTPSMYSCGGNKISQALVDLAEDKAMQNIETQPPGVAPGMCGDPVDTGLNYTRSDIRLDNRGRARAHSPTQYDHKVCANPVCTYDPVADECVKK